MRHSTSSKILAVSAAIACFSIVSGCEAGCGREPRHEDHPAEHHDDQHHDDQHHDDQHHDDQHHDDQHHDDQHHDDQNK